DRRHHGAPLRHPAGGARARGSRRPGRHRLQQPPRRRRRRRAPLAHGRL
ncbi:MAG: hypothetical protein AVDCRST_MAG54-4831, partial [uncultured Actinomycetospora sp.]